MPSGIPAGLPSIGSRAERSSNTAPAPPTREGARTQASRPDSSTTRSGATAPEPSGRPEQEQGGASPGRSVLSGPAAKALLDHVRGEPTEALRAASAGLGPESTRPLEEGDDKPVRLAELQVTSKALGGMDSTRMKTAVSRLAGNATISLRGLLEAKSDETGAPITTSVQAPDPDGDAS